MRNNRGIGILQALIGLAIIGGAFFVLIEITGGFRKAEKSQRSKMDGREMLSFVAGQFQALSYEKALCLCCRSLLDPLPAGRSLTRATVSACPESCSNDQPLHGFRTTEGDRASGSDPNDILVVAESCEVVAEGQALAFTLFADWSDAKSRRGSGRIRFIKSRW